MTTNPPTLADAVRETVRREGLLPSGTTVVVGVSGGPDSMALLRVLLDLRDDFDTTVIAAHFDHAVRPRSRSDVAFVREWAKRWGIPLHVDRRVAPRRGSADSSDDGPAAASGRPAAAVPTISPPSEAALRDERYRFLHRVAREATAAGSARGAATPVAGAAAIAANATRTDQVTDARTPTDSPAVVAVGHHADDRLETFLAQLLRGAGPRGLSLPRYRREDGVIRPLLDCTRAEIIAYLRAREIPWLVDPTNEDGSNLRARLRADVVPRLRRENPEIARTVGRTTRILAGLDDHLRGLAAAARAELLVSESPGEMVLDGPRGALYHPTVLSTLLREAFRKLALDPPTVGFDPLDRLARAWKEGARCVLELPGGLRGSVEPTEVRLERTDPPPVVARECDIAVPGSVEWPGGHPESPGVRVHLTVEPVEPPPEDPRRVSSPTVAWMDAVQIVPPLRVRSRRPGDRYRPLGLGGSAKVQDLFVDRKVPRVWRDTVPLVVDGRGILWIPGFQVDRRIRITDETKTALRVEVVPAAPAGGTGSRPPTAGDRPPEGRRREDES
jgi:tRNA(Ile)-lysidine synthase